MKTTMKSKTKLVKAVGVLLVFALTISSVGVHGKVAEAKASTKLKKACQAALKKTGNAKYLDPDATTGDPSNASWVGLSPKKISAMYYTTAGGAYEIYVVKAKTTAYAKKAYKEFAKHNKALYSFRFDYPKEEAKAIKNAVYGRKGKYVWYISMSKNKKKNQAGEAALKKKL